MNVLFNRAEREQQELPEPRGKKRGSGPMTDLQRMVLKSLLQHETGLRVFRDRLVVPLDHHAAEWAFAGLRPGAS